MGSGGKVIDHLGQQNINIEQLASVNQICKSIVDAGKSQASSCAQICRYKWNTCSTGF